MTENIVLKRNPKIEFQLQENGFRLIDERSTQNTGFFWYHDMHSIELHKAWYPRFLKFLRYGTWLLNGAPMVGCESSIKANLVINNSQTKLHIWLSDSDMTEGAKRIAELLNTHSRKGEP